MRSLSRIGRLADLRGDYLLEKRLVLAAPPAAPGGSWGRRGLGLLDLVDQLLDAGDHCGKLL